MHDVPEGDGRQNGTQLQLRLHFLLSLYSPLLGHSSSTSATIAYNLNLQINFWAIISVCNMVQRHVKQEEEELCHLKGNLLNTLLTCTSPRRCSALGGPPDLSVSALTLHPGRL